VALGELLAQGGWSMVPLYLCSVVALAVFVKKALELRAARLSDIAWVDAAVSAFEAGDLDAVGQACDGRPHPAANVVRAARHAAERRPERVKDEARRVGSLEIQRLERNLGLLSFIAQAAPLLGLLGTVLGMVDLFRGLQGSGLSNVDVSVLSSGIWKALLTTAAGLLVAVPAIAGHSYLASRTDGLRLQLSDVIERVSFAIGGPR
jgi:biopolymer transport protein ExbB